VATCSGRRKDRSLLLNLSEADSRQETHQVLLLTSRGLHGVPEHLQRGNNKGGGAAGGRRRGEDGEDWMSQMTSVPYVPNQTVQRRDESQLR
jgi:hypothetical protein